MAYTEFQHRQADCELRNTGQVCPWGDSSNYWPARMSSKYILSQAQFWRDLRLFLSSKVRFCCGARVGCGGRYEACCLPVTSCFQGMRGPYSRWQWGCKGESWRGCPGAVSNSTDLRPHKQDALALLREPSLPTHISKQCLGNCAVIRQAPK